ncbi:MAG: hypothetical protein JWP17_1790 [Solirubrobacterales bacterium]|nr:hypothetical protein [Solirubrobacterales bacterium]
MAYRLGVDAGGTFTDLLLVASWSPMGHAEEADPISTKQLDVSGERP